MPDTWELASAFARSLLYLGALGSVGLVLARIVFGRETGGLHGAMVRRVTALAALALLAAGIGFALKGAAMTGEPSGMIDPEMLGLLWRTPVGTGLAIRVAGLGLVLLGLRLPGIGLPIAAAGGLVTLWSFTGVGHVADAGALWLEMLLLLHLAGAAFWIGILSPLRTLAGDPEGLSFAAGLSHRFGRIAVFTVPVLIAAGIVMAWRLLGEVSDLVATGYGLTLLAKIAAIGLLLGAAAANKLRFVPAMRRGDRSAAFALRGSIAVEWAAVCFVLLATAVLTTVPDLPPGGDP
ncbi:MAG: CopD family protein [Alphaproteobacteria bacterium]|nr:CopD family protein [Alphaproteobacteria bacterium]